MKKRTLIFAKFLTIAVLFCLSAAAGGGQPTPLPDFALVGADGSTVPASSLATEGNWIIVYVQPRASNSTGVLRLFSKKDLDVESFVRVIVVVATDDSKVVDELRQKHPDLDQSSWYMDSSRSMAQAMGFRVFPMTLGVKNHNVEWDLPGVLSSIGNHKSIISSWLKPR
jgi:peroxiredoxin